MGQYQQWLLAQSMSQNLKAEMETLETELLYLKDRVAILEQSVPQMENVILLALQAYLHPSEVEEEQVDKIGRDEEARDLLVQELWHGLPKTETPTAELPLVFSERSSEEASVEGMEGERTGSPLLQGKRTRLVKTNGEERLVDKEARRLNENIQRWFDRWHRQKKTRVEEVPDER